METRYLLLRNFQLFVCFIHVLFSGQIKSLQSEAEKFKDQLKKVEKEKKDGLDKLSTLERVR